MEEGSLASIRSMTHGGRWKGSGGVAVRRRRSGGARVLWWRSGGVVAMVEEDRQRTVE
jgi:hypothetical protein